MRESFDEFQLSTIECVYLIVVIITQAVIDLFYAFMTYLTVAFP